MKNEIVTACYQFITALLNGTCQGVLLTVLVAGCLRLLGRTNAATRHAVWFGTLLLVAVLIPANWLCERLETARNANVAHPTDTGSLSASPDAVTAEQYDVAEAAPPPDTGDLDSAPRNHGLERPDQSLEQPSAALEDAFSLDQNTATEKPAGTSILAALDSAIVDQSAANERAGVFSALVPTIKSVAKRLVTPVSWRVAAELSRALVLGIPLLWLAIAGAKSALLFRQILHMRGLKRASELPTPELAALFNSLRRDMRVSRDVALKRSREHRSAVVLGFFSPVILLPGDVGFNEAEHVLRHELAHVCRRDDWANLLQHFIGAALFFHPAIYWMSKRISLEREIACDDQVLQSTRPRAYALLLAELAGRLQPSVLAPAISTNQSQLKQRIDMILNPNRNTSPGLAKARLGLLASVAATVAAAAIYSAPRVIFAQSAESAAPAAPTPRASPASEESAPALAAVPGEAAAAASSGESAAWPATPESPVAAGPKFKPGTAIVVKPPRYVAQAPVSVQPVPSIAPAPPVAAIAPVPALPGVTPAPAVAPVPPAPRAFIIAGADANGPDQPGQPPRAPRRGRDSSIEDRLDRLEKMVESLVAQQKNKFGPFDYYSKALPGEKGWTFDRKSDGAQNFSYKWDLMQPELEKNRAELEQRRADLEKRAAELEQQRSALGSKDKAKLKDLAEQQAKMAQEQAKMARDAEQMVRDAQRAARDGQQRRVQSSRAGARQELESLHRQHETLQRQMEKLERQIEKLEREQERSGDEQDNEQQEQDPTSGKGAQRSNYKNTACSDNVQMLQRFELPVAADVRRL
jgi:beta-lactamase regulating signal transducer with metallopeptidase domain